MSSEAMDPKLPLETALSFDIAECRDRLVASGGGYEVVHRSPGLELGVYVLVAPEPDRQQRHEGDEVYVVLEGRATLQVGGEVGRIQTGLLRTYAVAIAFAVAVLIVVFVAVR